MIWCESTKTLHYYCTVDCFDGELRLSEGQTEWEGRLEVCWRQRWGTIGSDGWTKNNSQVVCNALGYEFTGINYTTSSKCTCMVFFLLMK